jgi:multidrug resistance efflux pump
MIRGAETVLALALAATGAQVQASRPVLLSGQVHAPDAELILAPMSESSPVTLRYLLPEGTEVKPGDSLVRIDPGAALAQQQTLEVQVAQARARIAKELAELAVLELDAQLAQVDAEAALAIAKVDAAIPPDYIARIDVDRYAGELARATREFALKQEELRAARDAITRRREDGDLEMAKMQTDLDYAASVIAMAEQRAEGSGVASLNFNPNTGQRYEEGGTANAGEVIGQLVRSGALGVRAFALEPDRRGLVAGQVVQLRFDAVPGSLLQARITGVGGAPQAKAEWGSGRYFTVDIALPEGHGLPLRPGMSVRVTAQAPGEGASP